VQGLQIKSLSPTWNSGVGVRSIFLNEVLFRSYTCLYNNMWTVIYHFIHIQMSFYYYFTRKRYHHFDDVWWILLRHNMNIFKIGLIKFSSIKLIILFFKLIIMFFFFYMVFVFIWLLLWIYYDVFNILNKNIPLNIY